jgi:flagellar basal body-associated protein FliL
MAKEIEENQEAPSPKATSKKMKLLVLIGIIGGVVVLQAIIIVLFIYFFITPTISSDGEGGKSVQTKKHNTGDEERTEDKDANLKFVETGRITTNPKMSTKFVVINLGLEFKAKEEGSGEENLSPKMMAKIKGVVNQVLGSYLVEELHAKRDSIGIILKNDLKITFNEENYLLKDVILQEFLIQ